MGVDASEASVGEFGGGEAPATQAGCGFGDGQVTRILRIHFDHRYWVRDGLNTAGGSSAKSIS